MRSSGRDHAILRIAVDVALLTVRDGQLQVLLVTRRNAPFEGRHALPGGFVREHETVEAAAERELGEETSIPAGAAHLELLSVHSEPDRDPRGRVVSVAFLGLAPDLPIPTAGSDARSASWVPVSTVGGALAFDHDVILGNAVERARSRLEYTTMAALFCPPEFTIGDLQNVYEVVWGTPVDPRNFSRKVHRTAGFLQRTGEVRAPTIGRPAALYRRGEATELHPPLLREPDGPGSRRQS